MRVVRVLPPANALALERTLLRRLARALLEELLGLRDYELGVHFIGAAEMARLNEKFLGHEGSTDVITFNHQENPGNEMLSGEIFICTNDALIHARRFRVSWPCEVTRYLVHGVLHLEGFDDTNPTVRRAMKKRENRLLKELSTRFDLSKMDRT